MRGDKKLLELIEKNKRIIYISGHTHNRLDSDFPSAEADEYGNLFINTASIGNAQPCLKDCRELSSLRNSADAGEVQREINRHFICGSMGIFLDIYKNYILVKGYDFSEKKFIPRCYFKYEI